MKIGARAGCNGRVSAKTKMGFPFSYNNQIVQTGHGEPEWLTRVLCEHIATHLEKLNARNLEVKDDSIYFTGGNFLGRGPVRGITHGEIAVSCTGDQLRVAYHLSFVRLVLTVSTASGLLALGTLFALKWPIELTTLLTCIFWLCFFGANFVWTISGFSWQIKDQMTKVGKLTPVLHGPE